MKSSLRPRYLDQYKHRAHPQLHHVPGPGIRGGPARPGLCSSPRGVHCAASLEQDLSNYFSILFPSAAHREHHQRHPLLATQGAPEQNLENHASLVKS